jgi:hypothetical protein
VTAAISRAAAVAAGSGGPDGNGHVHVDGNGAAHGENGRFNDYANAAAERNGNGGSRAA